MILNISFINFLHDVFLYYLLLRHLSASVLGHLQGARGFIDVFTENWQYCNGSVLIEIVLTPLCNTTFWFDTAQEVLGIWLFLRFYPAVSEWSINIQECISRFFTFCFWISHLIFNIASVLYDAILVVSHILFSILFFITDGKNIPEFVSV